METKVKVNNVRCAYPSIFKKAVYEGQETSFQITLIIPKDHESVKTINAIVDSLKKSHFTGKLPPDRVCFKDGDTTEYPWAQGNYILKATSKDNRFLIVDQYRNKVTDEKQSPFYSGCTVNAIIDLWPLTGQNKRICASIGGVQFAGDGDPIGRNIAREDEFDVLEVKKEETALQEQSDSIFS